MFGYMCYILDIYTHKDYLDQQLVIEKIISKDPVSADYMKSNPLIKAFMDIKYRLLNKQDWNDSKSLSSIAQEDSSKALTA